MCVCECVDTCMGAYSVCMYMYCVVQYVLAFVEKYFISRMRNQEKHAESIETYYVRVYMCVWNMRQAGAELA